MKIRTLVRASVLAGAMAFGLGSAHAAEVEGPEVSWNLSTWGKPRAFTVGLEYIAEQLAAKTDGKFTLKIHYGEALSKARENLDGIRLGAFQAAQFCNFYHPGKNPAWMVLTMPFLPIGDLAVSVKVREALMAHPAFVADMANWNAMPYFSAVLPQYEFLGRGEPPASLADWQGKRVRAGGGIGLAMEKLGATRTTVPATEVYTGIERGTMDAASMPFTYAHAAYQLHEISDWFTANLSPGTSECATVLNKTAFEELPEQYRKLLMDLKPSAYEAQIAAYVDIDKKNLPMFKSNLTEVTYTEEQLDEFRKAAGKPVWDEWVAENSGDFDAQGLLDLIFSEAKKARQ
ncbi:MULTISPECIES: C4-dicarboxylate TRAP transporter substrate-binding protein [Thalassobaculum]|uniref:TRAP-type mannitol/chloroaromatic compound transport system, substrate-binding protein n=1 Tax=Thalassobaculum litoreum DSM 18839 TaxID=1123362 RepID=A0A8G2EVH5_9PROT|nr:MULTISPECIES: C4-dicarboxylate TRAP transporter substrate-binding protein [Thalassobaculum]SDF85760.1 TRAP-type mannitol/chloroaromatic compound transport system, substrate-binding protein [Thalassobaculum litoreum DSM 18839]